MKIFALNKFLAPAPTSVGVLAKCCELDQQILKYPWTRAAWESSQSDQSLILIYVEDEAFVLFRKINRDTVLHLLKIGLVENVRGSGTAAKILEKSILISMSLHSDIETIFLEVEEKNLRARSFYQKMGFKALHVQKSFYSDAESAVLMERSLHEENVGI